MSDESTFGFQWHLTDRCDLRCGHCYQERFDRASERPLEDLLAMADRVFDAFPPVSVSVSLTGGEPLLQPGFFALLDHLHRLPALDEVHVITNGTRTGDAVLEGLGRAPRLSTIKVSLEAAAAEANDRVRGAGTFERVLRGIDRLLGTGKAVVPMITLGRHNLGEVEGLARLARARGLAGVIYERFVPLGRGRAMAAEALDAPGWRAAVEAIARAAGIDAEPEELLPYRAFWLDLDPEPGLRGALCNLGPESMALMPDGTVYPCRRLPLPQGRVLDEPFEAILARLARFAPGALAPRLTGDRCGFCGVEACAGCRALAAALTGDPFADDPQCLLALEE